MSKNQEVPTDAPDIPGTNGKETKGKKSKKYTGDPVGTIYSRRFYKAGYEVRDELHETPDPDNPVFRMKQAYNVNGQRIGDPKFAKQLCVDRGIIPQYRTPTSNNCSIGYSPKDGKWYGWSHRAIYGFKVGSKVTKGHCAYQPNSKDDQVDSFCRFFDIKDPTDIKLMKKGFKVKYLDKNKKERSRSEDWNCSGRGEWTAKTMDEAKQIAMDFAEGVN